MLVYVLAVVFPLLIELVCNRNMLAVASIKDDEQLKKMRYRYILFAALPMFLLIALRHPSIGADTGMYINHFERMVNKPWKQITNNTRMELGYLVFVKLITLGTDSTLVFQIIYTTIYFLAVTSFISELEKEHFLAMFLFGALSTYTFMFTGVRQCLAISLCLLSFRFIKNRELLNFAFVIFVAVNFHKSVILFVVAYLIYGTKLSVLNIVIYLMTSAVAIVNLDSLQDWFNDQMDYDFDIESGAGGIIFSVTIIAMTAITVYLIINYKKASKQSSGLTNIGSIAAVFWAMRIFTRTAERPSFYFLLFLYGAFAYAISILTNIKEKNFIKFIVILGALALFVYRLRTNVLLVPYRFAFL